MFRCRHSGKVKTKALILKLEAYHPICGTISCGLVCYSCLVRSAQQKLLISSGRHCNKVVDGVGLFCSLSIANGFICAKYWHAYKNIICLENKTRPQYWFCIVIKTKNMIFDEFWTWLSRNKSVMSLSCCFKVYTYIQSEVKILAAMSSSSQSTPVNKFSPVTALQPIIHQWWLLISSRARACRITQHLLYHWSTVSSHPTEADLTSRIASLDKAPGKSCLLAKTSSVAPANLCRRKGQSVLCTHT